MRGWQARAVERESGNNVPLNQRPAAPEVSSAGWWPNLDAADGPTFYGYAYPEPPGFGTSPVAPQGARYDARLGEFVIAQSVIAAAPDPDAALLDFLDATFAAAADRGGWDRAAPEPPTYPTGLPRSAWSTSRPVR